MIRAIIFDLDDTLYEERDFFRGGFAAVAEELTRRRVARAEHAAAMLEYYHHAESRGGVFQKLAAELGFPPEWIPELVARFRAHEPRIQLASDAAAVLPRLKTRFRLGCVTDGWAEVQRRKISALGVSTYLDAMLVTDELGTEFWKPHARPFQECCRLLGVDPSATLVVGDNPERDIAGARNAGLRSVRIRRSGGYFANKEFTELMHQADFEVSDLHALDDLLAHL